MNFIPSPSFFVTTVVKMYVCNGAHLLSSSSSSNSISQFIHPYIHRNDIHIKCNLLYHLLFLINKISFTSSKPIPKWLQRNRIEIKEEKKNEKWKTKDRSPSTRFSFLFLPKWFLIRCNSTLLTKYSRTCLILQN